MSDRLPNPEEQPFLNADELWQILGGHVGRTAIYEGAREYLRTNGASGIPCLKAGKRTLFPVAAIRRWAMLDDHDDGGPTLRVVPS